jgi:hypothetical protein
MAEDEQDLPDTLVAAYRREIWGIIGRFEQQLIAEMGGTAQIGVREIHNVADRLREEPSLIEKGLLAVVKHAPVKTRPMPRAFARHDQLGRLLVSRFAHLFGVEKYADPEQGPLSRQMLPAFFQAVKLMVGLEQLQQLQDMTMNIVDELQVVPTGDEDDEFWDAVYQNSGAAESAMTVFVKVALRFKDFSRRKEWFINFVNENLAGSYMVDGKQQFTERWGLDLNVKETEEVVDGIWVFTETHFCELMSALFSDMQRWIIQADGLERIRAEFGGEAVTDLLSIFTQLDSDMARIRRERVIALALKEAQLLALDGSGTVA